MDGDRSTTGSPGADDGRVATLYLSGQTVAAPPRPDPQACALPAGTSTIVHAAEKTVVDPPTRHADEMSAQRPPSAATRGRSTTGMILMLLRSLGLTLSTTGFVP
jgi:hypothetical protein